jgi:hypothetical protein
MLYSLKRWVNERKRELVLELLGNDTEGKSDKIKREINNEGWREDGYVEKSQMEHVCL